MIVRGIHMMTVQEEAVMGGVGTVLMGGHQALHIVDVLVQTMVDLEVLFIIDMMALLMTGTGVLAMAGMSVLNMADIAVARLLEDQEPEVSGFVEELSLAHFIWWF